MSTIYASIVTFHTNHDDIMRLISCIKNSPIKKLFIIDNSSNDELREEIEKIPDVQYIHSLNLGYGSGHNIAIRKSIEAGIDYHIVINPDIYWTDKVVEHLSDFMNTNEDCGLVMPKIIYPNNDVQYLCKLLPTPIDLIGRRFLPFSFYEEKHNRKYEMHWTGYNRIMEIPSLSGCFMFMRCSILKEVGLFDERFFMYAEDLDLCRRIGEKSKTMFYPEVSVVHEYEKGSYKNHKLLMYHITSIIKYFNKWGWFFDRKRRWKNKACIEKILAQST